jgi:8-oxo-dGTP pyrophosphatase MutT (NUDIX family)
MTRVQPNWRDDGEYCIRSACGAKGPVRVTGKDRVGKETHFFCRTCRRCSERRVVLNGEFNWWVAEDAEIWHESSGVFIRNPDGRFLFFRRTIYPVGTLTVPSGHVDTGETEKQAAVRELGEEVTGLPDIPPGTVVPVATEDIIGDSCRRGSDAHRWHAFRAVLKSPIKLENVKVREEGEDPVLLSLAEAGTEVLTYPVRYVIDRHTGELEG